MNCYKYTGTFVFAIVYERAHTHTVKFPSLCAALLLILFIIWSAKFGKITGQSEHKHKHNFSMLWNRNHIWIKKLSWEGLKKNWIKSSRWCENKSIVAKNEVLNHTSCYIIAFCVLHYAETLLCLFNVVKQHRAKSLSRGLTPFFLNVDLSFSCSCWHVCVFFYQSWIFPMSFFKPRATFVCTL